MNQDEMRKRAEQAKAIHKEYASVFPYTSAGPGPLLADDVLALLDEVAEHETLKAFWNTWRHKMQEENTLLRDVADAARKYRKLQKSACAIYPELAVAYQRDLDAALDVHDKAKGDTE